MSPVLIVFLIVLGIAVIVLSVAIPLMVINKKYENFVLEHSLAIKELKQINSHYKFNRVKQYDFYNSYDNEDFYDLVSTKDYLTYQLVYKQKEILTALNDTYGNKIMYEKYIGEVKDKCQPKGFDTEELLKNDKKLFRTEKKLIKNTTKAPRTEYWITVELVRTNLNETRQLEYKQDTFNSKEIRNLITRINNKRGNFYLDQEIWQAICRVERGKVSNKMRFAIYARDGNRCRRCGRRTDRLEIDHIIPIAKGGKSTFDNLQSLCHKCNMEKGDSIEYPRDSYSRW